MEGRTDLRRVGSVAAGRRGSPFVGRGRATGHEIEPITPSVAPSTSRALSHRNAAVPRPSATVKNIRSSWRFDDDRDTKIDLARLAITHPVEADQFPGRRIQAHLQTLDLAQPTVEFGFLNPIL